MASLLLVTACAFAGGRTPTTQPTASADVDRALRALERAEVAYDAGRFAEASSAADSMAAAWQGRDAFDTLADRAQSLAGRALEAQGLPGAAADRYQAVVSNGRPGAMRDGAVERLLYVLADTGREPEAVSLALDNPGILGDDGLDALRQWVGALELDRLRGFAAANAPETTEATIVHVSLAQLLVAGREGDEARRLAAGALEGPIAPTERTVAELISTAEGDFASATVRIGAILPLTGDLSNVGELLREGIELAVQGYESARPQGFDIELEIVDDRSDPEAAAAIVQRLERDNVVAIIGPLRSESFAAAARARRNPRLPIISPTATEVIRPSAGAYTLYDQRSRDLDIARDLGEWTIRELGLERVAVLEPIGTGLGGAVSTFANAVRDAGGEIVARQSYDPTLTTYQESIEAIAATRPDVVFAPAATTPVVLAVAPQLFYYGLYNAVVLGSESWADPVALRRLEPFAIDHRVVGITVDRVSDGTRWQQFVADYERTYRKALRDNVLPALAYDATALAIAALEGGRIPVPAALTAYLESRPQIEGVTGRLRPRPESSTVGRATLIRMFQEGNLVEADRSELLNWLAEVRAGPSPFAPRDTIPR